MVSGLEHTAMAQSVYLFNGVDKVIDGHAGAKRLFGFGNVLWHLDNSPTHACRASQPKSFAVEVGRVTIWLAYGVVDDLSAHFVLGRLIAERPIGKRSSVEGLYPVRLVYTHWSSLLGGRRRTLSFQGSRAGISTQHILPSAGRGNFCCSDAIADVCSLVFLVLEEKVLFRREISIIKGRLSSVSCRENPGHLNTPMETATVRHPPHCESVMA